jgi:DNA mismatch endonuclease (patch repair protein)
MARRGAQPAAPSYRGLKPTSPATSAVGRGNTKRGTRPETLLVAALKPLRRRFSENDPTIAGTPDLAFIRAKVAVFVDGDFWHGRHWAARRAKLKVGANAAYWVAKIERNRKRDRRVTRALRVTGWTVLRLWETDIVRNPAAAARRVARALHATQRLRSATTDRPALERRARS